MTSRSSLLLLAAMAAFAPRPAAAQLSSRQARVEVLCPVPPVPVVVGGRRTLVYELHITNFGVGPLELRELRVTAAGAAQPLALLRDSALRATVDVGATHTPGTRLDPGLRLIAFLWLPLDDTARVPAALEHHLLFALPDSADQARDAGTEQAIDRIRVPVSRERPAVIRPPLEGTWVVAGPANETGHRRSVIALDGHTADAQRYAIDFAMVGPNGNTFQGDRGRNESYWAFQRPVLAVAAGTIVSVVDSVADNTPHAPLPRLNPANLPGNYVIERIGPGRYATYAHLHRGSIRVRPGMHVAAGATLAELGNSGQTTAPHLHFQVTDRPSVLAAEGVAYEFARYTSFGSGETFEMDKHPRNAKTHDLPADGEVVELP